MGCGVSKEDASGVLNNAVTQNGSAHHNSNNAPHTEPSVNKDHEPIEPEKSLSPGPPPGESEPTENNENHTSPDPEQSPSTIVPETNEEPEESNPIQENKESSESTKEPETEQTTAEEGATEETPTQKDNDEETSAEQTTKEETSAPEEPNNEGEAPAPTQETGENDDDDAAVLATNQSNNTEEQSQEPVTEETAPGDASASQSDNNNEEPNETENSPIPDSPTATITQSPGSTESCRNDSPVQNGNDVDIPISFLPEATPSPSKMESSQGSERNDDGRSNNSNSAIPPGEANGSGDDNGDIAKNWSRTSSTCGTRGNSPDGSEGNGNDPEEARMQSPEHIIPADENLRDEIEDSHNERNKELGRTTSSRNSTTSSAATIISRVGSPTTGTEQCKTGGNQEQENNDEGGSGDDDDDSGVVVDDKERDGIPKTENDEIGGADDATGSDCSEGDADADPTTTTFTTASPSPTIKERPAAEENGTCDLDLEDPDLEKAATRIQAAFRGHNTRKQIGTKMAEGEEVIDIDLNDPEVGVAASKIQASFRGHKAKREAEKAVQKKKEESELSTELQKLKTTEEKPAAEDEEDLPDLNDPEVNKAATKIQAHFKGHLVRKTLKDPKDASN